MIKFLQPFITFFIETVSLQLFQIFSKSFSCDSHYIQMQMLFDFFHDCRYAACIIEALCRPSSCRTDIQKISGISVKTIKGISCDIYTKLMSNCRNMKHTVCTSGNCSMYQDCIFKALHCYNIRRTHIFRLRQLHSLFSRFSCICKKVRTCCRHQSTSRKGKSQSFCHDLHS